MVVYYSIANDTGARCERQWVQSIRSLRRHNRWIPVHLFVYGPSRRSLLEEANAQSVTTHLIGDYSACFRGVPAARHAALAYYPTFHKFVSLRYLPRSDLSQVLYADCDTFFFGDVAALFQRYARFHWCAREEPQSRRSHYGYRRSYVDEEGLAAIAGAEGLRFVPPYNTGVCLMSRDISSALRERSANLVEYAWRLLVGMCGTPMCPPDLAALVRRAMTPADRRMALPYPSNNAWIVEQIATWLALGAIPRLSHDTLQRGDVLQDGEFAQAGAPPRCVMVHYYSRFEKPFFERVARIAH